MSRIKAKLNLASPLHSWISMVTRRLPKVRGLERLVRNAFPATNFSAADKTELILHGTNVQVYPSTHIGWHLYFFGDYEPSTRRLMGKYLAPGKVALDVGANIGWHTLALSRCVAPNGKVIAFEPNPSVFDVLCENIAASKLSNVDARNCGVSREPGHARFTAFDVSSFHAGDSHLMPDTSPSGGDGESAMQIPLVSIDSLKLPQCDLIKIDVEGFEPDVMLGASETIKRHRPVIVFEHVSQHVQRAGLDAIPIDRFLFDYGYHLFAFDDRRDPSPLNSLKAYSGDVLALPTDCP